MCDYKPVCLKESKDYMEFAVLVNAIIFKKFIWVRNIMHRKITFLFFLLIITTVKTFGQVDTVDVSFEDSVVTTIDKNFLMGYSGWCQQGIELGFGKTSSYIGNPHGAIWGHSYGAEFYFFPEFAFGPKISGFIGGGSVLPVQLDLIYLTSFNKDALFLRGSIGIIVRKFKVLYGRNLNLFCNNFNLLSKHNISVAVFIIRNTKIE